MSKFGNWLESMIAITYFPHKVGECRVIRFSNIYEFPKM